MKKYSINFKIRTFSSKGAFMMAWSEHVMIYLQNETKAFSVFLYSEDSFCILYHVSFKSISIINILYM